MQKKIKIFIHPPDTHAHKHTVKKAIAFIYFSGYTKRLDTHYNIKYHVNEPRTYNGKYILKK